MSKIELYEMLINGESTNCFIFEIKNENGSKFFCFQNNKPTVTVFKITSIGDFLGIVKHNYLLSLRHLEGLEVETYANMFYEAIDSNESKMNNRLLEYATKMYKNNSTNLLDLNKIDLLTDEENMASETVSTLTKEDENYIELNKPKRF